MRADLLIGEPPKAGLKSGAGGAGSCFAAAWMEGKRVPSLRSCSMSTVRIGVEVSERQRVGNLGQPALRQIPILIGRDSRLFLEDDVEV